MEENENYEFTKKDWEFLELASKLAEYNVDNGGGPFGAVIVKDGLVIANGTNKVTLNNDPTAHAEIVAIRKACSYLKTFSLKGTTIYTSCEPCPMCLSAIYWAGIDKIIFGNTKNDAHNIGFSDKFIYQELQKNPDNRTLPCLHLNNNFSINAFTKWKNKPDKTLY